MHDLTQNFKIGPQCNRRKKALPIPDPPPQPPFQIRTHIENRKRQKQKKAKKRIIEKDGRIVIRRLTCIHIPHQRKMERGKRRGVENASKDRRKQGWGGGGGGGGRVRYRHMQDALSCSLHMR